VECLYRLTYQRDSTDAKTRTETLRLQIGSKLSRCENLATLYMDSVLMAAINASQANYGDNEHVTINLNGIPSGRFAGEYKAVVFKAPTAGTEVVYDRIGETNYYQEPASPFAWVIAPTTANVDRLCLPAGHHQLRRAHLGGVVYPRRTHRRWPLQVLRPARPHCEGGRHPRPLPV